MHAPMHCHAESAEAPALPTTVTLSLPKRYAQAHTKQVHVSIALRRAQRDSSKVVYKYSVPEHSLPDCHAARACPDEGRTEALPLPTNVTLSLPTAPLRSRYGEARSATPMPCTLPCTVTLSLPKRPCTVTLSQPVLTKEGPKRYYKPVSFQNTRSSARTGRSSAFQCCHRRGSAPSNVGSSPGCSPCSSGLRR